MSDDKEFDDEFAIHFARMSARSALRRRDAQKLVEEDALAHPPDWTIWRNVEHARLPQLVALSCGIDPLFNPYRYPSAFGLGDGDDWDLQTIEYKRRFRIAASRQCWKMQIAANTYAQALNPGQDISLSEFREWGESLDPPFTFPEQYPNEKGTRKPRTEDSLDQRERTTLLCIIAALVDTPKLDISQPYKAGEALAAQLALKGITIDPRTVCKHLEATADAIDRRRRLAK